MSVKKILGVTVAAAVFNLTALGEVYAASVAVKCEFRVKSPIRSKASVDGAGFTGSAKYVGQIKSAVGIKTTAAKIPDPVTHEIQFDFDSDPTNIQQGATAIPANFFSATNKYAIGYIRSVATGAIVARAPATCVAK